MIKSFIASTREIDDAQAAVADILTAIDPERNLLKNSLGVISCFSDFTETGVLKAICDALPFDCIGATTCLCAAGHEIDQIILTVTVLTSDDCSFSTALIPVADEYERSIDSAMKDLLNRSDEKPVLLLGYFPLITALSGDMLLTAIDKATGGVPVFGTIAVDHTMDYSAATTIYNGESFREAVVMGAVYGAPKISFGIASLNEKKIRKQKAIITESNGNILIGVNGKPALEYLEDIGLTKAELSVGVGIVPLVIDHKDGTKPIARGVFGVTPDGYAICGGAMPVNATLALGRIDKEDVLQTTKDAFTALTEKDGVVLSYSCVARYFVLGADNTAEAKIMKETSEDTNYLFASSGGEICPLQDAKGKLKNCFHNYTIVFCKLS